MKEKVDFSKVKTSWTKFDIVQVLDAVYSKESIQKFVTGDISIDKPILRSFLGIKTLQEPIPSYWYEIQKYPKEKICTTCINFHSWRNCKRICRKFRIKRYDRSF